MEEKIKWVKRQKAKLQKQKDHDDWVASKKAEEERIENERKEYFLLYGKPKKYQIEIDVCDNLLGYLVTQKPKVEDEDGLLDNNNNEAATEKLTSGDWQKEKMHILSRDSDYDQPRAGGKKHKKKGKKGGKKEAEDPKLTITLETLTFFDQVKVEAPLYMKDIEECEKKTKRKKKSILLIPAIS